MIFSKDSKGEAIFESDEGETIFKPDSDEEEIPNDEIDEEGEVDSTEDEIAVFEEFDAKFTKTVSDTIENVRKVSKHLKSSTKCRNVLRNYSKLSPITDVKVRWNSTY